MKPADYGRLLLLAAIWGASFLFMRIAAPAFGAVNTTFLRVLFALIGLAVMLLLLRAPMGFQGKLKSAMLLGVINSAIPFLMYAIAALWLPAGRATARPKPVMISASPTGPATLSRLL